MTSQTLLAYVRTLTDQATRETDADLQEHEDKGWVFSGTTPMEGPKSLVWVFRRAKIGANNATANPMSRGRYEPASGGSPPSYPVGPSPTPNSDGTKASGAVPTPPPLGTYPLPPSKTSDPVEALEQEIRRLQDKLDALKKSKPQE